MLRTAWPCDFYRVISARSRAIQQLRAQVVLWTLLDAATARSMTERRALLHMVVTDVRSMTGRRAPLHMVVTDVRSMTG